MSDTQPPDALPTDARRAGALPAGALPGDSVPDGSVTDASLLAGSPPTASSPAEPSAAGGGAQDTSSEALPPELPHAGVRYAVLRLGMFVTVGGVLYLIGMRGWALLFAAVILSGIASFFVFLRQREAAAVNLERSVQGLSHRRQHAEGE